jgi:hypothetical protein
LTEEIPDCDGIPCRFRQSLEAITEAARKEVNPGWVSTKSIPSQDSAKPKQAHFYFSLRGFLNFYKFKRYKRTFILFFI